MTDDGNLLSDQPVEVVRMIINVLDCNSLKTMKSLNVKIKRIVDSFGRCPPGIIVFSPQSINTPILVSAELDSFIREAARLDKFGTMYLPQWPFMRIGLGQMILDRMPTGVYTVKILDDLFYIYSKTNNLIRLKNYKAHYLDSIEYVIPDQLFATLWSENESCPYPCLDHINDFKRSLSHINYKDFDGNYLDITDFQILIGYYLIEDSDGYSDYLEDSEDIVKGMSKVISDTRSFLESSV